MRRDLNIAVIGRGTIGAEVARLIGAGTLARCRLVAIVSRSGGQDGGAAAGEIAQVSDMDGLLAHKPDLVVEAAGVEAFGQFAPACLHAGIDVLAISLAAMADREVEAKVEQALAAGQSRLLLASGSIGALDALSAAREGGLDEVSVIQRKPPHALMDEEAARKIAGPTVMEQSIARRVALAYPKNANVVAAVALAGIGFDRTRVTVIADPAVTRNGAEVHANGRFGELKLVMANKPSPDNPRTAMLPAMSLMAALRRQVEGIVLPA